MLKKLSLRKVLLASVLAAGTVLFAADRAQAALLVLPPGGEPFGPGESFTVVLGGTGAIDSGAISLASTGLGVKADYGIVDGCFGNDCAVGVGGSSIGGLGPAPNNGVLTVSNLVSSAISFAISGTGPKTVAFNVVVTPLPAAAALFGTALVGLGWMRRRRNRTAAA